MHESLGEPLAAFTAAFDAFCGLASTDPILGETLLAGTEDWAALLTFKLVPHLAGEGCLVVALAGGTNTGKSSLFNLLLGQDVSPVVSTAAATRHPVLAGNPLRAGQCLTSRLVPEFNPRRLEEADAVLTDGMTEADLFVAQIEGLPDRLVLLDTPDVDSIDRRNWVVADNIRAAGDVIIAVLTGEKYRDERVVDFFRKARATGRLVVPLMNKINPAHPAVAQRQLDDFRSDVGITEGPSFVIPHDFALCDDLARPIHSLDNTVELRAYIESLDVPSIKMRVYRDTVRHAAEEAQHFLDRCAETAASLHAVIDEFEARAVRAALDYDPAPGAAVGGLFHEFVQSKRGPLVRWIGAAGAALAKGAGALARALTGALRTNTEFSEADRDRVETEMRDKHQAALARITRELAASCFESARSLREPAAHLLEGALESLDPDAAVNEVVRRVLRTERISDDFRNHAIKTLDIWWTDQAGRRHALEALDALLAVMPAAIAAPLSMYTAGFGVAETVAIAGPVVEQFVARVIEYQFGDQMFDLLSPWRAEQQQHLEEALHDTVTGVFLQPLRDALEWLEGPLTENMRKWQTECLHRLETS